MTSFEVALVSVLALVVVLLWALLVRRIVSTRARVADCADRTAELAEAIEAAPIELRRTLGDGQRQLIAIEILNPLEVASEKSKFARAFGGLAPRRLRAEVTKRTVRELESRYGLLGVAALNRRLAGRR